MRGALSRSGSEADDNSKGSICEMRTSLKSDMNRGWLSGEEAMISQAALNQLSYILEMARREVKLKIQYGNPEVEEKIEAFVSMRRLIVDYLFTDEFGTIMIEKRVKNYIYAQNSAGLVSALYLLIVISDDEFDGFESQYHPFQDFPQRALLKPIKTGAVKKLLPQLFDLCEELL